MQPHRQQPYPTQHLYGTPPQWGPPPQRRRTSPAVIVLAVIGGVLALCLVVGGAMALLGEGEETPSAEPTQPAAATTAAAAAKGDPDAYLAALAALDPEYADNERAALSNGDNICQEIAAGKTPEQLARNAALRFSAPAEHGAQLVELARKHYCG